MEYKKLLILAMLSMLITGCGQEEQKDDNEQQSIPTGQQTVVHDNSFSSFMAGYILGNMNNSNNSYYDYPRDRGYNTTTTTNSTTTDTPKKVTDIQKPSTSSTSTDTTKKAVQSSTTKSAGSIGTSKSTTTGKSGIGSTTVRSSSVS